MSGIYDNWERLVVAVLKREENWEMAHAPSRSLSSISCISSSDLDPNSSSRLGENRRHQWVENFQPGVHIILEDFGNGRRDIILVGFSRRRFEVDDAVSWWGNNQENLYGEYNDLAGLGRIRHSSKVNPIEAEWIEQFAAGGGTWVSLYRHEDGWLLGDYNGIPRLALVKDPILETNFDEILTSANLDGPYNNLGRGMRAEKIQRYEHGVYVSLGSLKDGIRDLERVRFSRNIFKAHEAKAWWLKNREKVFQRYVRQLDLMDEFDEEL